MYEKRRGGPRSGTPPSVTRTGPVVQPLTLRVRTVAVVVHVVRAFQSVSRRLATRRLAVVRRGGCERVRSSCILHTGVQYYLRYGAIVTIATNLSIYTRKTGFNLFKYDGLKIRVIRV